MDADDKPTPLEIDAHVEYARARLMAGLGLTPDGSVVEPEWEVWAVGPYTSSSGAFQTRDYASPGPGWEPFAATPAPEASILWRRRVR